MPNLSFSNFKYIVICIVICILHSLLKIAISKALMLIRIMVCMSYEGETGNYSVSFNIGNIRYNVYLRFKLSKNLGWRRPLTYPFPRYQTPQLATLCCPRQNQSQTLKLTFELRSYNGPWRRVFVLLIYFSFFLFVCKIFDNKYSNGD